MTAEKLKKANFIKDKIDNLMELSRLISDSRIDGFDHYIGAIRHIEGTQGCGDEIINKVKITEDIQNKLLLTVNTEIEMLAKEFKDL